MVATIIATDGSTPAPALSKMVVTKGNWIGTVGGGCMEADVVEAARSMETEKKAGILKFTLNEDDMIHGLICGGSLHVLIEPVTQKDIFFYNEIAGTRNSGTDCVIGTRFSNGTIAEKILVKSGDTMAQSRAELTDAAQRAFDRTETQRITIPDGEWVLEPIPGQPELILFGAGHVSKFIARAASSAGFRVIIVDDRTQYANKERFPDADEIIVTEYHEISNRISLRSSSYVVIVTRGHQSDEDILAHVINHPVKYIGMIGSKRKIFATYEHLVERGIPPETLGHVHAPMGLDIGASSPEEIAISVVAELISIRRKSSSRVQHKSSSMQPLIDKLK